jgi:hypothetical protein
MPIPIPLPESRVPVSLYIELRQWLLENDTDAKEMLAWSTNGTGMPGTPEHMAGEIIWIILCAGRSAQAARTIERKVRAAIEAGTPVVEAFGYRAKAEAIERAWRERKQDYEALWEVGNGDAEKLVAWCGSIPFVGDVRSSSWPRTSVRICASRIFGCAGWRVSRTNQGGRSNSGFRSA